VVSVLIGSSMSISSVRVLVVDSFTQIIRVEDHEDAHRPYKRPKSARKSNRRRRRSAINVRRSRPTRHQLDCVSTRCSRDLSISHHKDFLFFAFTGSGNGFPTATNVVVVLVGVLVAMLSDFKRTKTFPFLNRP